MKKLLLLLLTLFLLMHTLCACANDEQRLKAHIDSLLEDQSYYFWALEDRLSLCREDLAECGFVLTEDIPDMPMYRAGRQGYECWIFLCASVADAKAVMAVAEAVDGSAYAHYSCLRKGTVVFAGERSAVANFSDY